jgi:hypothetical protein
MEIYGGVFLLLVFWGNDIFISQCVNCYLYNSNSTFYAGISQWRINPLKPKLVLIIFKPFSPYHKENAARNHYKDLPVNTV